ITDIVGPKTTTYRYDANGNRLANTLPNGVSDAFTYDALNRVLTHVSAAGGAAIYSAVYAYDLANNRRTVTETVAGQPSRIIAYNYDSQYRLISETSKDNSSTYTYDLAGNRLSKNTNGVLSTYTYDARNEVLTEVTAGVSTNYVHDLHGNRVHKT